MSLYHCWLDDRFIYLGTIGGLIGVNGSVIITSYLAFAFITLCIHWNGGNEVWPLLLRYRLDWLRQTQCTNITDMIMKKWTKNCSRCSAFPFRMAWFYFGPLEVCYILFSI